MESLIEEALRKYSQDEYYQTLITARERYFHLTGATFDDDDDFEGRMNSFNYWYLFEYIPQNKTRTMIRDCIIKKGPNSEEENSLLGVQFSLFEYLGKNLRDMMTLKDIWTQKKTVLSATQSALPLVKNDYFIGRYITFMGKNNLLPGYCLLPIEVKPDIYNQLSSLKGKEDLYLKQEFLLKLEFLKTKWKRYGHINAKKLFTFA